MDAISLAKTSVADAFHAVTIALTAAEKEIAGARAELENAKRDAALGLSTAEKAASEAAAKAGRAVESVVRDMAALEGSEKAVVGEAAVNKVNNGTVTSSRQAGDFVESAEAEVSCSEF